MGKSMLRVTAWRTPLFAHVEVKMEKQVAGWINCEHEYVSAIQVLFAKL